MRPNILHSRSFPYASMFLSKQFSSIGSTTTSFRPLVSRRKPFTSGELACRVVSTPANRFLRDAYFHRDTRSAVLDDDACPLRASISSAVEYSPRRPSKTIRIFSCITRLLRFARRISLLMFSASNNCSTHVGLIEATMARRKRPKSRKVSPIFYGRHAPQIVANSTG